MIRIYKVSDFNKTAYRVGEAATLLGISPQTVRNYEKEGYIKIDRTEGGHRIIKREELIAYIDRKGLLVNDINVVKHDIIYARVSRHEQKIKGDLNRQVTKIIESVPTLQNPIILKEVGSGLNDKRQQLQNLITMVMNDEVNSVYVTYKDRLTRFGFHYLEIVFLQKDVKIHVLSDGVLNRDMQQELVEDMMCLIASFSGKLYGMRSHKKMSK